jgi:predicted nucleic acid-binding protein
LGRKTGLRSAEPESQRHEILGLLTGLPSAEIATDAEVLDLIEIEAEQLYGLGVGYVDAQILAATRLTADARLWTADKRLAVVARRLGLLADIEDGL